MNKPLSPVANDDGGTHVSFTNQKQRIATEVDIAMRWGGQKAGKGFRCYMCGHSFQVGDKWRWIYAGRRGVINALVCESCDGADVLDRWVAHVHEGRKRYWWIFEREYA